MVDVIHGVVVEALDGDTFRVQVSDQDLSNRAAYGAEETIRIAAIDAPGIPSASGLRAKWHLGEHLKGRTVRLEVATRDRQGQLLCWITVPETSAWPMSRAPRVHMPPGVEVHIGGRPAALMDLSMTGAQVVLSEPLRPAQHIPVVLPIHMGASVVWVRPEILREGSRYRAGLVFRDADPAAIEAFCGRHQTARECR